MRTVCPSGCTAPWTSWKPECRCGPAPTIREHLLDPTLLTRVSRYFERSRTSLGVFMQAAVRPWVTTGIALVSAGVIAATPIAPPPPALSPQVHIPQVEMPKVELTASIADILTFPSFRQWILNRIDDVV